MPRVSGFSLGGPCQFAGLSCRDLGGVFSVDVALTLAHMHTVMQLHSDADSDRMLERQWAGTGHAR